MRRRLLIGRVQQKRRGQDVAAEADIGEIALAADIDQQQHVDARGIDAGRHVP